MSAMRIVTANVNGIRAAVRREGLDWLAARAPRVLALQETRASEAQLRAALAGTAFESWHLALEPGAQAGRAGVAVLSADPLLEVRGSAVLAAPSGADVVTGGDGSDEAIDDASDDHIEEAADGSVATGRWIEADLAHGAERLTVISAYIHTGSVGLPIQQEKYAMLRAVTSRLADLREQGRHVVLTGDLNICHTQRDLKNWKGNIGKAGFLPEERAYLTGWFDQGWVDLGRNDAGEVDGPYTWWSWRGKAFDNDAGWRIDYQVASPALAAAARSVEVGRAPSYAERWSDHAAVMVDFDEPAVAAWLHLPR